MASRTGISWTASDTAPTFRDGEAEAYVELRRDQPNGHYSHLDVEAYLRTADGPQCIARLNLTEPGDIPSTVSGADGLASRIADRLNHPQFPKAGTYGPTAGRMRDWYRGVEERFAAMSEENRRTRAIEPDEEAYHVGMGMYVTAEQFADVLPSPPAREPVRDYVVRIRRGPGEPALERHGLLERRGRGDRDHGRRRGRLLLDRLHVGRGRLSGPVGDARHGGVRPYRRQDHLVTRRTSMYAHAYPPIPFL
ncbi:hypothetical protein [Bifidobacterium adolescentis]|uniref:hypothetical protein n=1 Tax=Bifidobacterium adolescentis TaxID=1680 RepID=UPI003BA08F20